MDINLIDDVSLEIDKELNPELFTLQALLAKAFSKQIEIEIANPVVREPFKITGFGRAR